MDTIAYGHGACPPNKCPRFSWRSHIYAPTKSVPTGGHGPEPSWFPSGPASPDAGREEDTMVRTNGETESAW